MQKIEISLLLISECFLGNTQVHGDFVYVGVSWSSKQRHKQRYFHNLNTRCLPSTRRTMTLLRQGKGTQTEKEKEPDSKIMIYISA